MNKKDHFFPSDFFEPISPSMHSIKNENSLSKSKSIYVNLQKEEEEDKELIDLLDGKRK
jgi:hypothetical protein